MFGHIDVATGVEMESYGLNLGALPLIGLPIIGMTTAVASLEPTRVEIHINLDINPFEHHFNLKCHHVQYPL